MPYPLWTRLQDPEIHKAYLTYLADLVWALEWSEWQRKTGGQQTPSVARLFIRLKSIRSLDSVLPITFSNTRHFILCMCVYCSLPTCTHLQQTPFESFFFYDLFLPETHSQTEGLRSRTETSFEKPQQRNKNDELVA
jgi:hypothetical protein